MKTEQIKDVQNTDLKKNPSKTYYMPTYSFLFFINFPDEDPKYIMTD